MAAGPADVEVSGRSSANTVQAQMKAALASLGICPLPVALPAWSIRAGHLVEVMPGYGRAGGGFYVVHPSPRQVPRTVSAFVDLTVNYLLNADLAIE
ncbi:MAG: LysR family transcriptional regulator [Polaromonas sp.]|nr:LysR family transcriptional regulator [Polaromonas sp.]